MDMGYEHDGLRWVGWAADNPRVDIWEDMRSAVLLYWDWEVSEYCYYNGEVV